MVFSKELGYDPDEWEECSDSEQFMLFGFTTRMFLSLTSVILTVLFFWFLEARKQIDKFHEAENLSPKKNMANEEMDKPETVKEKMGKLRQAEANFSKEETEALKEWQREVARMEELRLQDLVEHVIDASGTMSEIETESQLIDRFLPADCISMETNSAEMEQFQQLRRTLDQTPSAIATNKFANEVAVHSAPHTEDVVANIQDAANTIVTGSERGNGSGSSTNGWEAPAQSEFFVERVQEFIYKPSNTEVTNVLVQDIPTSIENDDDFVKVYKDELQKNDSGMLLEQIAEANRQTSGTLKLALPDTAIQKTLEQKQKAVITELSPDQLSVVVIAADYNSQENQQQFILTTPTELVETERTCAATDSNKMNIDGKLPAPVTTSITERQPLTEEECRRLVEAEMYIQDAIEYVASEIRPEVPSGFIVEEEMLNNTGGNGSVIGAPTVQQLPASAEATSQMFRTNEVEEPVEIDDAMTYAPEIQSIEIPPDEASVNSENLLDYFDQVAAECTDFSIPQPTRAAGNVPLTKPVETSQSASLLRSSRSFTSSGSQPPRMRKRSSLLSVLGVTSMQEMLLALTSLEDLSNAMRKAGLQSTNLIFGIDYTASNKYQGERCFQGRSLHSIDAFKENPYQQVIKIMGRILAPFATSGFIPAYGFGDVKTSDWSVFKLKPEGECKDLDELLQVYDTVTPTISLSGPTNFAPLIYEAIEICEKVQNYHILVIVADGQVTNEKATRKAIVRACQYPLSIIVVGVGDGPWDMMKVFDESLPRRPWDNFHFVEFHEVMQKADSIDSGELSFAVQSLLEIPDQYNIVRQLGLLRSVSPIPEYSP
ncbi:Copine family protein [Brugia malayi]|uniref:BMA-CPNA-1, isoform a n=2 Tax=Brugia malayi TaxID=6279 RepID=A0A0J9XTX2_BRUMA|nr:Copine family protein [Brugia malayi]CDP95629.2 BMA-CPNA-1, isoform a [Brugia malayi]VIO94488.1 Copine family protein [Brugia malayi]